MDDRRGEVVPPEDEEEVDGEITADAPRRERRLIAQSREFSGPLPAPDVLAEYEKVKPGLSDIIVEQWTKETAHRHSTIDSIRKTDHEAMVAYYEGEKRGQWIGLAAFIGLLLLTAFAIYEGSGVGALGGIIVAGSYAIWALRRQGSVGTAPEPIDLSDGDAIESQPGRPEQADR